MKMARVTCQINNRSDAVALARAYMNRRWSALAPVKLNC